MKAQTDVSVYEHKHHCHQTHGVECGLPCSLPYTGTKNICTRHTGVLPDPYNQASPRTGTHTRAHFANIAVTGLHGALTDAHSPNVFNWSTPFAHCRACSILHAQTHASVAAVLATFMCRNPNVCAGMHLPTAMGTFNLRTYLSPHLCPHIHRHITDIGKGPSEPWEYLWICSPRSLVLYSKRKIKSSPIQSLEAISSFLV